MDDDYFFVSELEYPFLNELLTERDEARRVARQWYREAKSLRILHEYDLETIKCYRANNMEYYRRAEAAEKRIKELEQERDALKKRVEGLELALKIANGTLELIWRS